MKSIVTFASLILLSLASVQAEDSTKVEAKQESKMTEAAPDSTAKDSSDAKDSTEVIEPKVDTTASGVMYQELVIGEGKECKLGTKLECHYTLWFGDSTGTKTKRFQSSKDSGNAFTCTLGSGLIKGWSDGMVGMKEGGTRRLIISPELGYGKGGRGIPPNQWLVFEIDFIKLIK